MKTTTVLGIMAHAFNSRSQKTETIIYLNKSQPGLQSKFDDSQGYAEKPYLKGKMQQQ